MLTTSSNWSKPLLLAGLVLAMVGLQGAFAQNRGGQPQRGQAQPQRGQGQPQRGQGQPQRGQSEGENRDAQQSQNQAQEEDPFIHGVSIGGGLAIYQGDYSRNPNHNVVKYIAGSGKLSLEVGVDHRLGEFDQYGFGADVVYSRLGGKTRGNFSFKAHSVALDFYADYELPYVQAELFRVFVGGGPNFIISPSYGGGVPGFNKEENYQELGTRMIGSLKVGVTILDAFRIGTRIASTDLLDGYKGYFSDGVPDFVSFLSVRYRFNLKE